MSRRPAATFVPVGPQYTAARLTRKIDDLTAQRDEALEIVTTMARDAVAGIPLKPFMGMNGVSMSWMVSMRWDCPDRGIFDRAESTGVLIGPRHVLTTASLFDPAVPVPSHIQQDHEFVPFAERTRFAQVAAFGFGDGDRYEIVEVKTAGFNALAQPGPLGSKNDLAVAILDKPVPQAPIPRATTPAVVGESVVLLGVTPLVSDARRLLDLCTYVADPDTGGAELAGDELCVIADVTGATAIGSGFRGGAVLRITGERPELELLGICSRSADLGDGVVQPVIVVDTARAHDRFLTTALRS